MKYVVAVSGGVDSVVLLHMLASHTLHVGDELVVAHFDHGIRPDSAADARFVKALAQHYGILFEARCEELGANVSEAFARERRYAFLRSVAKKYSAKIITAHHMDDLVETIFINFQRGTGWRGLAVLSAHDVVRPLLHMTKQEIYQYALNHSLEWVEDETNQTDAYYRNRVRRIIHIVPQNSKEKLYDSRNVQVELAKCVDDEVSTLLETWPNRRYLYQMINQAEALEVLRAITTGVLTRPQLKKVWFAIKTAKPGSQFEAGNGVTVKFSLDEFTISMV